MSDAAAAIQKVLDDVGDTGVMVWVVAGPAVDGTEYDSLIAYVNHPEPEIENIVPLDVGLDSLVEWLESYLEDIDDGPAFSVVKQCFTADQLAAINCRD